jgi:hypothetical protein
VVDIDIPFGSMIVLMVKWIIAAIPAFIILFVLFTLVGMFFKTANAASADDIDKMTTYAAMLGRASACGSDTEDASRRVGAWLDERFQKGPKADRIYMRVFLEGMTHHAREQAAVNSPDIPAPVESQMPC